MIIFSNKISSNNESMTAVAGTFLVFNNKIKYKNQRYECK